MMPNRILRDDFNEIGSGLTGIVTNLYRRRFRETARSAYRFGHGSISLGKRTGDWVFSNTRLDRVVNASGTFIAENTLALLGMYVANKGLEGLVDYLGFKNTTGLNDLNPLLKTIIYSVPLAYLNLRGLRPFIGWRGIISDTVNAYRRNSLPSLLRVPTTVRTYLNSRLGDWGNYVKAGIVGMALWGMIGSSGNYRNVEAGLTETSEWVSGEKIVNFVEDIFSGNIFSYYLGKLSNVRDMIRNRGGHNPSFSYRDSVSNNAKKITAKGISISPEQLAYIARVGYWEASVDPKARNESELLKGLEAVFHVMKNRWEYDQFRKQKGHDRYFSRKGPDLFNVVFNKRPRTRWYEFTCINYHPKYFYEHEGNSGWDMYEGGKINIAIGNMDEHRSDLVYRAFLNVFLHGSRDSTNGALFYQNYAASDRANKNWRRKFKYLGKINSHDFYTFRNNDPNSERNLARTLSINPSLRFAGADHPTPDPQRINPHYPAYHPYHVERYHPQKTSPRTGKC